MKISGQFKLGALLTESSHPVTANLSEVATQDIAGALELLLVTPLPVEAILAGQRRAFREVFRWPIAVMWLVNSILLWLVAWANPMRVGDEKIVFAEIFIGGAVILLAEM